MGFELTQRVTAFAPFMVISTAPGWRIGAAR